MIEFDAPKEMSSMIKVVGVGGGGSNAVNHMFKQGIKGVDFVVCNTDAQALDSSPVPNKIQLGICLTGGRGAGSIAEVGKNAAIESVDELKNILVENTEMMFITAGMGGGTGTGAAPIIAAAAKELGILTVGIVTVPFAFEGRKREEQAKKGIEELRKNVDTLLIISNEKLRELHGNLPLSQAFGKADDILTDAARGIAELITVTGYVNVDIEDVKTVMRDSGVAIMGTGTAKGENRAFSSIEMALSSPLLNNNNIKGASSILLFIASGNVEIEMDEITTITDYIQDEVGLDAEIIWGNGTEEELGDSIRVTIVATNFSENSNIENSIKTTKALESKKIIHELIEEEPKIKNQPINNNENDGMVLINRSNNLQTQNIFELNTNSEKTEQNSKTETITIYELDTETPQIVNKNDHETNRKIIEESVLEINPDFQNKSNERILKLRGLSKPFTDKDELSELENTPAYIRRGVALSETQSSQTENISRYSLDFESGEIKSTNSFLHDNVD